jgi:hypothetical protein
MKYKDIQRHMTCQKVGARQPSWRSLGRSLWRSLWGSLWRSLWLLIAVKGNVIAFALAVILDIQPSRSATRYVNANLGREFTFVKLYWLVSAELNQSLWVEWDGGYTILRRTV